MENTLKTIDDFKKKADELMDKDYKLYFSAGAGDRSTPPYNEEAFQRYFIRPKMLRNVSQATLNCRILNTEVSCPIGVSPTAMHSLVHPDGEVASAGGCSSEGCIFIMSSGTSQPIDLVSHQVRKDHLWMQIYIHDDREVTLVHIKNAEKYGFSALVVTVDNPVAGLWRDFMPEVVLQAPVFKKSCLPKTHRCCRGVVTFDELKWLKDNTQLPIVAKGILSGEDAVEVAHAGASAILVSNHGGRMIQRVVPTIHVLEEIVDAVKDTGVEVYLDGGIRSGTDILVALSLGAKAVFVGRPIIWGLSVDGKHGVQSILRILKDELLRTMQLAGVSHVGEIQRNLVQKI